MGDCLVSAFDDSRGCRLAELAARRSLGSELHSGKLVSHLAWRRSLPRLSLSLRATHLPGPGDDHQADGPRVLASHSVLRDQRRPGHVVGVANRAEPTARRGAAGAPRGFSAGATVDDIGNLLRLSAPFL